MNNVTAQEALKAAIEVIEQAIPDKRGEFEEQQKLYENYPNLAYKYDYLKVEADEMQQALDKCKSALVEIEKCEPFGYFKAEPFGWTDCAETDEGAIALYEAPTVQREGWVSVPIEPTEEMIDAARWEDGKQTAINVYKLMVAAAPTDTE